MCVCVGGLGAQKGRKTAQFRTYFYFEIIWFVKLGLDPWERVPVP